MKLTLSSLINLSVTIFLLTVIQPKLQANTLWVTSTTDGQIGSLRAKVNAANSGDTIRFSPSTDGVPQVLLNGEIVINKGVRIIGNDSTNTIIEGNGANRIFRLVSSGWVIMEKLTLTNGNTAADGGIIQVDLNLLIGPLPRLDINECFISNGNATNGGGINMEVGPLEVRNSIFQNNQATNGGAIATSMEGTVDLYDVLFYKNEVTEKGGAVFMDEGWKLVNQRDMQNVEFLHNKAKFGGGLYLDDCAVELEVENTLWRTNNSTSQGGGFYNICAKIDLTNCILDSNSRGAIFNLRGEITFSDGIVNYNHYGGIYTSHNSELTAINSDIIGNSGGSAIFVGGSGLTGDINASNVSLHNVNLISNSGGAAVYIVKPASGYIESSRISKNTGWQGGGVYCAGSLGLTKVLIDSNSASLGGGIFMQTDEEYYYRYGYNCTVNNCAIYANNGGGIYNYNGQGDLLIQSSTISSNSGSGLSHGTGYATIRRSTIVRNSSGVSIHGHPDYTDVTFSGNLIAENVSSDISSSDSSTTSFGYNLIGRASSSFPAKSTDSVGTSPSPIDPLIDDLKFLGQPIPVHPLLCGSPAIDLGPGSSDAGAYQSILNCNSICFTDSLTVASDTSWRKSTITSPSNWSGYWGGVNGNIPANGSFTDHPAMGQPYNYAAIYRIPGTEVINSGKAITFFRKEFCLEDTTNLSARIRITADDQAEIYLNRTRLLHISSFGRPNFKSPEHDVMFESTGGYVNGFNGGDQYNYVNPNDFKDIFTYGTNEIIVVLRNLDKASDLGGFSFRMDLDAPDTIVSKAALVTDVETGISIYPNPTNGEIWINIPQNDAVSSHTVVLFDMNGRVLSQKEVSTNQVRMDLSGYASGVYFIKINSGETVITEKVVKQ